MTQAGPAHPLVMAWTPQQDLEEEEESSSDGGLEVPAGARPVVVQPKFSPRSHVFSLSLPRDDRLCLSLYADNVDLVAPKVSRTMPAIFVLSLNNHFISSLEFISAFVQIVSNSSAHFVCWSHKEVNLTVARGFLSVYIHGCRIFFLCSWFRAAPIYINNRPTRCNTKLSICYSASSLYMFQVLTTPIIRSTQNCNYSLRYWS